MNNTFHCTKAEGMRNGATDCVVAMLTDVVARTVAAQIIESMSTSDNHKEEH